MGLLLPRLQVSDNRRFLVTADGRPFFWLGDTAWELFHRLDPRRRRTLSAEPRRPALHRDPGGRARGVRRPDAAERLRPHAAPQQRPDAAERATTSRTWTGSSTAPTRSGLYVGFLPTWGDKWNKKCGAGPEIFTPENAAIYGEWLGRRYKDAGLVWILGGDRPVDTDAHRDIIRAMARGLRAGDGGAHLITLHPPGGERLVDLVPRRRLARLQHAAERPRRRSSPAATIRRAVDYDRTPVKPVIDGEPIYEDHPVSFDAKKLGHSIASDVRRAAVLGSVQRCVRPHLRPPLGLADVDAGARADQQPADAVDRGDRPARRGADAARPRAASNRVRS